MTACIGCGWTPRQGEPALRAVDLSADLNDTRQVLVCDAFCLGTARFDGKVPDDVLFHTHAVPVAGEG